MAKEQKLPRWYFGGLASCGAGFCTHPLDLIKVHLQTHQEKVSIIHVTRDVIRKSGFLALYNGISAGLLRQMTYSTTRFGMYEVLKQNVKSDTFVNKVAIASVSGMVGGVVGTPADMVNVRMQNDIKLPPEKRRNYKHALDGLIKVYQEEGFKRMFSGATTASSRAVLMTVGQLSFYDQIKMMLLKTPFFVDNVTTHFTSSLIAASFAVIMTQPLDVVKTRMMSAYPKNIGPLGTVRQIKSEGFTAFYKGLIVSSVRIYPATIIMFVIYEQLTQHFGYPRPMMKAYNVVGRTTRIKQK
ncbi:mitochondrial dicarboxylate carrier isoform X1 [Aethina tumida]|uniref:mitochondrial dicarboxylate carrier isoform X1 n=1 Tax=Aethina tumida TaxID=116153 RepID=UPI00096B592C|nr:mitochondrial dicarboxylate carrier isoform X1 [Aethina tumida]XP_019880992.1 mitochondrial dicarboxylate carrier isoform X1 [Aethina tumida]XP_049818323.1 mitochondrial dicarboxylate carrier isoform X1 [Aethina tumida]